MTAIRILAALCAVSLLSGCVGFHQQWSKAKAAGAVPPRGIEGAWIGTWKSGMNGHGGKLRCVVTREAGDRYQFYYWATWARVLNGGFRIECEAEEKGGKWAFSGKRDLGALGGEFSHRGEATPAKLSATFRSQRGDHGSFELARP